MKEKGTLVPRITEKRQKVIMLPEIINYIQQPNRVTEASYDYTLVQKKILTAVIYYLQEAIKNRLNGQSYEQLQLFKDSPNDKIHLKIPLRELTASKQYYHDVRESAKMLASIVVKLSGKDPFTGKTGSYFTGLMSVFIPDDYKYDRYMVIEIEKEVAKRLMEIEKNDRGIPINYTRLAYEIIMRSKNKYTPRIYEMISSWKKKGGFVIALDEFRSRLMLGDKYITYKDLKARVLKPAYDELYEKADCWFNCLAKDFEVRKGKTVTHLNFKIIVPELKEMNEVKRNSTIEMLRAHFQFKEEHFSAISTILDNPDNLDKLNYKLIDLNEVIQSKKHTGDHIALIPNYIVSSVLNYFK
jgi:Initiator Replication protein